MAKVTDLVSKLALPVAEEAGCELWDVEYVREAGTWYLRIYLDKDGGVDILAYTDPLGTQGPRIKVQVKQQQKAVTEPDLKSFMANIGQHDSGIFFCTGGFTKDAEAYARSQESMLVDSAKLVQLWTDNIPRLSDQAWQRLPLTPIYFLTPEG